MSIKTGAQETRLTGKEDGLQGNQIEEKKKERGNDPEL